MQFTDAVHRIPISIHAPLAGSDQCELIKLSPDYISIHAPLAGSDAKYMQTIVNNAPISIHAPLAGSDRNKRFGNNVP